MYSMGMYRLLLEVVCNVLFWHCTEQPRLIPGANFHARLGQPASLQCHVTYSDNQVRFDVEWFCIDGAPCKETPKHHLTAAPPTYSLGIEKVEEEDSGLYECRVTSLFSQNEASGTVELIVGKCQLVGRF